jgi:hypothetical protein
MRIRGDACNNCDFAVHSLLGFYLGAAYVPTGSDGCVQSPCEEISVFNYRTKGTDEAEMLRLTAVPDSKR